MFKSSIIQLFNYSIIVILMFSCGNTRKDDVAVAKVRDKYLYFSEMKEIFPKGCTNEDSLSLAKMYIDNWIKTRLMLQKAELNLSPEELNISEELENYRTSLLIYKYRDRILQEKLDTMVSDSQLKSYYESNLDNFTSNDYFVKAVYIKLPKDAPNSWNIRRWLASALENDIEELTDYCRKYAVRYSFFDDEWILWTDIERLFPQIESATRQMKQNNLIEQHDDNFKYFVHIREKRTPGDPYPLSFVKNKVKSIIINKRKLKFISELERNIYNDALEKNQFEIYKLDN